MAFSHHILFCWFILNTCCVLSLNIFGPQPKIIAEDGHLFIRAAEHRNISLQTKGRGKVQLNGVDLSNTAELVRTASNILNKYKTNFEGSFTTIDRFGTILEGKNGILSRLTLLEAETKNFSSTGIALSNPKLTRLTRQLKATQDSLKAITSLLTKDECQSHPCANGGICQDLFNDFICHCPEEWEGRLCDTDVNECARFVGTDLGCQNGATCINKRGSYQCLCPNGWYGIHCTRRSKDCNSGASSSDLCGHGTCISQNSELGYTCICDQGWTKDGSSQECSKDVDECNMSRPPCSVNPKVTCQNTPGSFRCGSCPPGYTGNGYYCVDINECEVFNGGCGMNPLVQCINTVGSRKCGPCPPGYIGDGVTCSYRGICNVNNGNCHPSAVCRDYPRISSTFVECKCPPGYTGNGVGPNGCVASVSSPCSPNPCQNGECSVNSTSYAGYNCKCNAGFFGKNCDQSFHACANNPCKNGGICVNVNLSFKCLCKDPWTGPTCSSEKSACGGVLTGETGKLKYPLTNFSTRSGIQSCAWIIVANNDKILNITFKEFHLKLTADCSKDWLQIHDGRNTASHILGRFCGNDLPKNGSLTTSHNSVYIWYRSDGLSSNSGFELSWNSSTPTCTFNATVTSHGSLQSPGSPGNYPNNRDCFWSIKTPPGKRVLFHFFSLNIGSSFNCTGDYLEFFSSFNQKENPFAKYCNSSILPPPQYSLGPEVLVHFHSDEEGQYPGFQISYSVVEGVPGCGGVFTSDFGEIKSPSFKGKYISDLSCIYKIKLADRLRIKLEFISMELEFEAGCKFDSVNIYEGPDTDAPLIGRYCGSNLPAPYISNGNEITVHFKTDWGTAFGGFVLRYETVCGGKYTASTGVIVSDGYPVRYTAGLTCIYEIIQPLGFVIKLSFSDFQLESSTAEIDGECYDYVEIRDGDNENATLVGKYCEKPPLVVSSLNYLWIKFISDESVGGVGFRANYSTTNVGCGGIMKAKVGSISSPGTGSSYDSNLKCNWVITAPPGSLIRLTWISFQIERRYICDYDYVLVYDNNTIPGRGGLLGKYCGNKLPPSVISTSNIMTIVFVSDKSNNNGGFTLSYNFIDEAKLCGGNFQSPGGVIRSPGYPKRYSPNSDCVWTISVESGRQIMLNISTFEIEQFTDCKYDWLEIRNGKTPSSPLIGRFCGTKIPKLITSHANQIYVHFKSDIHGFGTGFEIIWESAATGCGGTLTSPSGSIESPMYPESYSKFTDCYWRIATSSGSKVQLIFTDIDLEAHTYCLLDYVELYDGRGVSAKSLGRFCSPARPPIIFSTQNQVYVYFKTDISFQGRGFQLQYSTVCNNNLTGFYGVIESPNFPNQYSVVQSCTWNIRVESLNKINITFSQFDIRKRFQYNNNKTCETNYLEIKYQRESEEEVEPQYDTYGRYCGRDVPKMISFNHDHARIEYVTDASMIGIGFRLEWVLDGCGGKLYSKGSIQSPNYPKGYTAGQACRWEIEADIGHLIEIVFIDVDIEKVINCQYDSLKVFNGPDDTYPVLGHFCHQDSPIRLSSIGTRMSVYFSSDVSYNGRGFQANFTSVKAKCGGRITIPKGSIFSPNYPNNYDKNDTCEWLLEVDENHLIDLEFEDVTLVNNPYLCKSNYIKVYDGPSIAYPVLATVCGTRKPNNTITSTHNTLTVVFKGHSLMSSKGFKANFHKACGARVVATSNGNIQMHPDFVDTERIENCSWTILANEPDEHVSLHINHMTTSHNDCYGDYYPVVIYNGESSNSTPLGQYCGAKVPPTITSRGNALHIIVSSQTYFFATYSVYDSRCGGTINSFMGNLATPGYPGTYPIETDCEWTLQVAPGNHISLSFQVFDLPQSSHCKTDFLEIRENNSSGKILGVYCGTEKPDNLTNLGSLWLYFKSSKPDGVSTPINAKGFIAEYILENTNVISAPSGQIGNPLYPNLFWTYSYSQFTSYSWRISVTFGKKISFKFIEMHLESYNIDDCTYAGLRIYDGIDSTAALLKTACGFDIPDPVKTTSNEAFIEVDLNSGRTGSKFLLEWHEDESYSSPPRKNTTIEGCGSKDVIDINDLRNYTLKSPGYPNGYANDLQCEWIFSTTSMNHLVISFQYLDLEAYYGYFSSCYLDYVEVSSGKDGTQDWEVVKRICTHNETYSVIQTTNFLKVKFSSNYNGNGTGFEALVAEACGGNIHDSEGFIKFEKEMNSRGRRCAWNITVKSGRTIQIDFLKFDISSTNDKECRNYVTLRNGLFSDSPLIGKGQYCETKPPILNTTGNQLHVTYAGSPRVNGFIMHFKEISFGCGGTIELNELENSTTITSPNYPNISPSHIDCVWVIRSPPGTIIQLDFQDRFDLVRSSDCKSESVEIRNGATEFSPPVGRFCEEMPGTQYSTDNMMYVKFFTDVDNPTNGFKAVVSLASCGGTLRGTSGSLVWSSTNRGVFPNQNCTWRIIAPEDYSLTLRFEDVHFRFSYMASCNRSLEKLSIYTVDNLQNKENLVKTICTNNDRRDLVINGNEAVIRFTHGYTTTSSIVKSNFLISYNATQQHCSFDMNTASGVIKPPSYSRNAYSYRSCKWAIKVPEGRRITLTFLDLDLDETEELHNQGIAVVDMIDKDSIRSSLAYIRNNNGTSDGRRVVKSSGNTMFIFFWFVNIHGRGFYARYTSEEETVCKGSFNEASGSLVVPTEPKFVCLYRRRSTSTNVTLKASFQMHLGFLPYQKAQCRSSAGGALVYSGGAPRRLIFDLCANTTSPVILRTATPSLDLQIWRRRTEFNYSIDYDTYNCGGLKTDEIGSILSPYFPNKPPSSFECSWTLKLPEEQQINLTFSAFDLGDNCEKSFLEIFNGETHKSPRIGKFCKNDKPGLIVSERNILVIDYHFEKDSKGKGFNLTYQPVIKGCGGIFHDKSRIIQSPGYPNDYGNNTECVWEIRASEGYHIGLTFIDRFHLEESDNCIDDSLKVWEWKNDDWSLLKTLCGRETPKAINSTGNRMRLMFRSNSKIQARGFKAKWEFNCGGTFVATNELQYIVSPGFPLKYDNNMKCEYKLKAPAPDQFVNLQFTDFDLEFGMPRCISDNVTINRFQSYYQGSGRSTFCGSTKPPDDRFREGVTVRFLTDFSVVKQGFRFSFNTNGCGGNITSPTKISSPTFKPSTSAPYYGRMKCQWNITAPSKKIIIMRFESLQTPYSASCSYDNLIIYNGHDGELGDKLATLCGNLTSSLPTIPSPNNTASIMSYVDPVSENFKFSIDIFFTAGPDEGCGGTFNLTSTKIIQSPNIDEIADCNWKFIAPVDNQIEFEITDMNLPSCSKGGCSCSFLELRDGGTSFSTTINKICNTSSFTSAKYQTSTRYGFLRYHMKGASSNAFRVLVKPILSPCGKSVYNVTNEIQTLTSPNYPNQYPENLRCRWVLKSKEEGQTFVLRFKEFDLSDEGTESLIEKSCQYDYLEIEDGNQHDTYGQGLGQSTIFAGRGKSSTRYESNLMGVQTFCGRNEKLFDFHSPSNVLSLIFQSKYGPNRGKGFKLEYQLAGCNQNYTRDSGKIVVSLNEAQDCLISITVAANRTISLYFTEFFGSYTNGCTDDSLKVIDGDVNKGTELGKYCGYGTLKPVFSKTNTLWLKLHSVKDFTPITLKLSYTSTEENRGCGGSFYDISGAFTSPMYPNDYRNDTLCTWEVRGPKGSRLQLNLVVFDLQAACNLNYLNVTTYDNGIGNIHHFCKEDEPAALYSSGRFTVTYQSSVHNGGRGWTATFKPADSETILRIDPIVLD